MVGSDRWYRGLLLFMVVWGAILLQGPVVADTVQPLRSPALEKAPDHLRQGAESVLRMCVMCHSLRYVRYVDLEELGFSTTELARLRGDRELDSSLTSMTDETSEIAVFGVLPPDLSLISKARRGGSDYVYTLLTSYRLDEKGEVENGLFPGTNMPDVLGYAGAVTDEDRRRIERKVAQIAMFLDWAADPHQDWRRRLGVYVLMYLTVLTVLLYLIKRKVWARLG